MAIKLDLKYLYLCSSAHDCIANYKFEWWYCLLTVALNCFQARKQPATCSVFQLCYCILIQTSLKGERFLLPVVMIVMVLSNLYSVYRLQSEVDEVLENKESVSAEDLGNLQYTEQVNVPIVNAIIHSQYPSSVTSHSYRDKMGLRMGDSISISSQAYLHAWLSFLIYIQVIRDCKFKLVCTINSKFVWISLNKECYHILCLCNLL